MTSDDLAFEVWWSEEGSRAPERGDDMYEHCKRQCELAFKVGAHHALNKHKHPPVPEEIMERDAQRRELPAYMRSVPGVVSVPMRGVDIDAVHMRGARSE